MKEKDSPDISGIVLAGGKSVRLGRDKLVETIGDTSLLQRVLSCLGSFNRDIIIVTAGGHDLSRFADHPRLIS
jgi:molybdopterin-guanine dinucleotide biosynthesis protein A